MKPNPLGAFNPNAFLIILVGEVLALRLFFSEGVLIPNFIISSFILGLGLYKFNGSIIRYSTKKFL